MEHFEYLKARFALRGYFGLMMSEGFKAFSVQSFGIGVQ